MNFIINDNVLKVQHDDKQMPRSGTINDYLENVITDNSWEGLTVVCKIIKEKGNIGIERAVINGQVYIDKEIKERYAIGFIGYTIESNVKTYQKSTNLVIIPYVKGAGEIETEGEEIPTPSEWEIYVSQIQEFIRQGQQIVDGANNLDVDSDGTILTITKKDGTTKEVNVKGEKGDCNFATFEVNSDMELVMNKTEDMLLEFNLNENSELEVII